MPKKRRTPEEVAELARRKGFNEDVSVIDDTPVHSSLVPCTEAGYARQWGFWLQYTKTRPNASPFDLQTAKHFIEFVALGMDGIDDEDGHAKVSSVRANWRRFASAWARRKEKPISEEVKNSIVNYIKGDLAAKISLSKAERERHFYTLKDFVTVQRQRWQNDWLDYPHEMLRVLDTAAEHISIYSSARIGEHHESSARVGTGKGLLYRDMVFAVRWGQDAKPEIIIKFCLENAKGMQNTSLPRPTHAIYEHTDTLAVNPVLFILAVALADSAFRDYSTLEEILAIEPPLGEDIWRVEWKESILDTPFFRRMTPDGPTTTIESASAFADRLADIGHRAGYLHRLKVHDGRREALVKADDNGYSEAERMKFAGHLNPKTFPKYYMAPLSTVDGQASFLGQKLRKDYIEDFRSMALNRHPQLWQSLPAKLQYELECRPDFVALTDEILALSEKIKSAAKDDVREPYLARRRALHEQKRQLTVSELKRWRKLQPRRLPSSSSGKSDTALDDRQRAVFPRVRRFMPERDRLATTLFVPATLRSEEGRTALRDLIALCTQPSPVAYHPSLRPRMGRCLVPRCSLEMESIPAKDRWRHVYQCYEAQLQDKHGFAQLCFPCDEWITDKASWNQHCQDHLDQPETLPLECDPLVFRHALVAPGYCPFCQGNLALASPVQRMCQFMDRSHWQRHIYEHVLKLDGSEVIECKHLQCSIKFESTLDLEHHLQDIHGIKFPPATKRRRQRSEEGVGGSRQRKRPRHASSPRAKIKVKERSSSPPKKAECIFINLGLEAFEPKPSSGDTSPLSVISTGIETPTTSAAGSTAPTSMQGDQATAQELDLPSLDPKPREQSTSPSVLRSSALPCSPDLESLRLEAEKARVAADEAVLRSSSRIRQKRKTWEEWKADRYDSDEERQLEDAQYEKELHNLVETGGNAPPEWATDPDMQHMTRTTRAMARKLTGVQSQPVTRNSKRKRQKKDGRAGKRKRPILAKPEEPIFDCIVLRPFD